MAINRIPTDMIVDRQSGQKLSEQLAEIATNVKSFGAKGDGVADDTAAIQSAIDLGRNVFLPKGTYKTTSPITVKFQKQILSGHPEAIVKPNFIGDCIRMINHDQWVSVLIDGGNQPSTAHTGNGAVVIGYGGVNTILAKVSGTVVTNYNGHAFLWEHGPQANFENSRCSYITGSGYRMTANYDDNNHGFFANCHAVYCNRGFEILSNGTDVSSLNSRHHVFVNAKGFGCQKNFHIETKNNVGTIFSELGVNPDELTTTSLGNFLQVVETDSAYQSFINNGSGNRLEGYSSWNQWETKEQILNKLRINARFAGFYETLQTADRTFETTVSGTTAEAVTVRHKKGTASQRTDIFEDRIQFPGSSSPIVVNQTQAGTLTVPDQTIASGATISLSVPSGTALAGANDTAIVTLTNVSVSNKLQVTGIITNTGQLDVKIYNPDTVGVTLTSCQIRWLVMKHYA